MHPAWGWRTKVIFFDHQWGPGGKWAKDITDSDHIDFPVLPGTKYDNFVDHEASETHSAVANDLLGVFAGLMLKSQTFDDRAHKGDSI